MVESSRLVFKLLCEKLKSLNFDFKMDTTTQFNLHHNSKVTYQTYVFSKCGNFLSTRNTHIWAELLL